MSLEIKILGLILIICGVSVHAQVQNADELRKRYNALLAEVQQLNATYNRIFDEQFNASLKIEELEKQLNATPDANPALTAEIKRLEVELFNCTEITKYCKDSIQSSVAGGIKGLILSALDSIHSIKKKVADILHKKINSLRINLSNASSTTSSLSQPQTAPNSSATTPMPSTTTSTTQRPNARNSRSGGLFGRLFSWFM